jgi:hypothetical protein
MCKLITFDDTCGDCVFTVANLQMFTVFGFNKLEIKGKYISNLNKICVIIF